MFKIYNIVVFIKYLLIVSFMLYILFKIFHYYYTDNYCDHFSAHVIQNTPDDIRKSKACVNTLVCEIGNVQTEFLSENGRDVSKNFSCIRKYKPGVWK